MKNAGVSAQRLLPPPLLLPEPRLSPETLDFFECLFPPLWPLLDDLLVILEVLLLGLFLLLLPKLLFWPLPLFPPLPFFLSWELPLENRRFFLGVLSLGAISTGDPIVALESTFSFSG